MSFHNKQFESGLFPVPNRAQRFETLGFPLNEGEDGIPFTKDYSKELSNIKTRVIGYEGEIDGILVPIREHVSNLNGDLGRVIKIEKRVLVDNSKNYEWRTITDPQDLKDLKNDPKGNRRRAYEDLKNHWTKVADKLGLDKSILDNIDLTDIPVTSFTNPQDLVSIAEQKANDGIIEPFEIFAKYDDIFDKNLKYPIDMFVGGASNNDPTGGSQDYMYIEQFEYRAPQRSRKLDDSGNPVRSYDEGKAQQISGNEGVLTQGLGRRSNLGIPRGSCMLPIPNKLSVSQGVNWGEGRANAVELAAFQQTREEVGDQLIKGLDIFKLIGGGISEAKQTLETVRKEAIKAGDGQATSASVLNAVISKSILSRIGINVDVNQFITRETGAAMNPNLELLFGGPQLRSFSFIFNFAPNSEKEAKVVRQIQRWFRQGMLPQKTQEGVGGGSLFLGSPNIFRLCYKNNQRRIRSLNAFKMCAVTSVQVDFTPDNVYQSYEDSSAQSMPVRSTMQVTFNELTPIFANDYDINMHNLEDTSLDDIDQNIDVDNRFTQNIDNSFTEDDIGF